VVILEDRRKVNPVKLSGKTSNLALAPFSLSVLYNEKSKLSLAELSAKFDTLGSIL
jgi:hypothetical protein